MAYKIPNGTEHFHIKNIDASKMGVHHFAENIPQKFYPIHCCLELISVNGLASIPTISVGSKNMEYKELINPSSLEGFVNANHHFNFKFEGITRTFTKGSTIGLYIHAPATGGNIEYKIDAILLGIFL